VAAVSCGAAGDRSTMSSGAEIGKVRLRLKVSRAGGVEETWA
jgi:hypothetical protein